MTQLSRDPYRGESGEEQLQYFRSRCDMEINADDLILSTEYYLNRRGLCHIPAYNRALRADAKTRLQAIGRLDLTSWKSALMALFIAATSSLPISSSIMWKTESLIKLLYAAGNVAGARRTLKAYALDRAPGHYFTSRVLLAIETALVSPVADVRYRASTIATVANLSALHVSSCRWKYRADTSLARCGYFVEGENWSLLELLAGGWAHFADDVRGALQFWASSTLRGADGFPLPLALTEQNVIEWSSSVIEASVKRGDGVRRAWAATEPGGNVVLKFVPDPFRGQSQFLALTLNFAEQLTGALLWHSGGFSPSALLRIEDLLVHPSVTKFGKLEWNETS